MELLEGYSLLPSTHEMYQVINAITHCQVRNLKIYRNYNDIVLTGRAKRFYTKQMAQESIRSHVPVGYLLKNRIVVE